MKIKYLLIFVLIFQLFSCQKDKGGDYIDTLLTIHIVSEDGSDLLNPSSDGAIRFPFLEVYSIMDDTKTKQLNGVNINKYEMDSRYYLLVNLEPDNATRGKFTYVLEYKDRVTDTLTASLIRQGGNIWVDDVRVNGTVFPKDDITIIKNDLQSN